MKNLLLFASILLIIGCNNASQQKDSTKASTLKSESLHPLRNGFSIFALGSNIKDYSKSVKLIKEEYHTQYYEVTDSNLLNIHESLKVDAININTWDGYISLIEVKLSDPYKAKFLDLLIDAYGIGNNKPSKLFYLWYFKDRKLIVSYTISDHSKATFTRNIDTPLPSKELIYQAKKNINDI